MLQLLRNVVLLGYLGAKPIEAPYLLLAQVLTASYFAFFFLLIIIEKIDFQLISWTKRNYTTYSIIYFVLPENLTKITHTILMCLLLFLIFKLFFSRVSRGNLHNYIVKRIKNLNVFFITFIINFIMYCNKHPSLVAFHYFYRLVYLFTIVSSSIFIVNNEPLPYIYIFFMIFGFLNIGFRIIFEPSYYIYNLIINHYIITKRNGIFFIIEDLEKSTVNPRPNNNTVYGYQCNTYNQSYYVSPKLGKIIQVGKFFSSFALIVCTGSAAYVGAQALEYNKDRDMMQLGEMTQQEFVDKWKNWSSFKFFK